MLAATKDVESGLVLNCVCNGQVTLNELVKQINKLLGKNLEPIYANKRPGDVLHSFADIKLIEKKLNYRVNVNFPDGLLNLINNPGLVRIESL